MTSPMMMAVKRYGSGLRDHTMNDLKLGRGASQVGWLVSLSLFSFSLTLGPDKIRAQG